MLEGQNPFQQFLQVSIHCIPYENSRINDAIHIMAISNPHLCSACHYPNKHDFSRNLEENKTRDNDYA